MYRNGILGLDCERMYSPFDIAEIVEECKSFDIDTSSLPSCVFDFSLSVSLVIGEEFHNCTVVV